MASVTSPVSSSNSSANPSVKSPTVKTEDSSDANAPLSPKDAEPASSTKAPIPAETDEDAITQAVQVLSNLATLKLKVQESREQALHIRSQVDLLFSDEAVSEEVINQIKDGFKTLKTFAQMNLRYREARLQAEQARATLDRALQSGQA